MTNCRIRYVVFLILFGFGFFLIHSCATPRSPTGGPPDRTPPEITGTSPANETVNFDGREVEFRFSKFMNRNSIQPALSIEPDLAIGYEIRWGRRSVTIRFDEELPENTTIILKLGTELQDYRNNNLATPFDLAISTGPEIDQGIVTGRVRMAHNGSREAGVRIYLYREPFDLNEPANYVAQTDTGGTFRFSYLSEDSYKAFWMDDQNRNRIWERGREAAQPFRDSTFTLEAGTEKDLGTIYIHRPDTTSPELRGVGLLTENRLRLRFNEEIYWDDDARIAIFDSLGNRFTTAYPLYVPPEDLMVVLAQTEDPLPPDHSFTLDLSGLTDASGNAVISELDPFTGSAQADTVALRIIGDNRDPGLFADQPLVVGYSKFIDDESVTDSLRVVVGEEMTTGWPHTEIQRHRLQIFPDGEWASGISHQFLLWNPARDELRPVEPRIWRQNQLGSVEVTLQDTSALHVYHLTLIDEDGHVHADTTFSQQTEIDQLAPLTYTAIIFRDDNLNGRWDSGSVDPFRPPAPYYVRRDISVREGFTSQLSVAFE